MSPILYNTDSVQLVTLSRGDAGALNFLSKRVTTVMWVFICALGLNDGE